MRAWAEESGGVHTKKRDVLTTDQLFDGTRTRGNICMGSRKVLFLVAEDWYFLSHRLDLARACRDEGWRVSVATRVSAGKQAIKDEGFRLIPIRMLRQSRRPILELATFVELIAILRQERPDVLHHVGLKPVIYGSLAAFLCRPAAVINALAGLGYVFTSGRPVVLLVRWIVKKALRVCFRPRTHWLIVQNDYDASTLVAAGIAPAERVTVIRGSGVDIQRFQTTPDPVGLVSAAVVSRMLRDKGIQEAVLAARELKRRGCPVRLCLAGVPDPGNPSSIDAAQLQQWHDEGVIEWLGWVEDVPGLWAKTHIAVLPSYREGVPKTLLEACASGRPVVTTDIPGCRDIVVDGVNGFTVPVQDWKRLADAIEALASDSQLRTRMGLAGRKLVEEKFAVDIIVSQTMALYRRSLWASR